MKQSDDSDKFFEKYGFTQTYSAPHPVYKDIMTFEGLEAEYVGRLERELEHYKKCLAETLCSNERLLRQEHYHLQDRIKKMELERDKK